MAVEIGDDIRIGWKFMDSIRDKSGGVWVPVFIGVETGKYLPERNGFVGGITGGKSVNRMKITT